MQRKVYKIKRKYKQKLGDIDLTNNHEINPKKGTTTNNNKNGVKRDWSKSSE